MRLLIASSLLLFTACATISHGPMETIRVESNPTAADASIRCDGGVAVSGTTPAALVIPRRADGCTLTVGKSGYAEQQVPLIQGWSGRFWANFGVAAGLPTGMVVAFAGGSDEALFAGLGLGIGGGLGFLVDHLTGSKYDRDTHHVVIDLTTNPAPQP
jgi:hypothetical protein